MHIPSFLSTPFVVVLFVFWYAWWGGNTGFFLFIFVLTFFSSPLTNFFFLGWEFIEVSFRPDFCKWFSIRVENLRMNYSKEECYVIRVGFFFFLSFCLFLEVYLYTGWYCNLEKFESHCYSFSLQLVMCFSKEIIIQNKIYKAELL